MNTPAILIASSFALLLGACASQQSAESPQPAPAPQSSAPAPAPQAQPVEQPAMAMNPLHDPNSILAKRSVYFDFDKSNIKPEFNPLVEAHAGYMTGHASATIRIEGNCDERGSREYNLALGQRRADSLRKAMVLLGVSDQRIETVSWGKEKPRAPGHNEAAWAQNRRDDIIYTHE
ncbi:MAG TPA: peptidoglycan-associated lipoprotein Pal [Burkholderiales bacterium]|nr:peptidoglycan-associated lipoprotein Pal [Burkholderiales bacterium]